MTSTGSANVTVDVAGDIDLFPVQLGTGSINVTSSTGNVYASDISQSAVNFTGATLVGSNTVKGLSTISGLAVGQTITGPGILAGSTILSISGTQLTFSASATATVAVKLVAAGTITLTGSKIGLFNARNPLIGSINATATSSLDVESLMGSIDLTNSSVVSGET